MSVPVRYRLLAASLTCSLAILAACARPVRVAPVAAAVSGCRADGPTATLRWTSPDDDEQRRRLDRWCDGVGPPIIRVAGRAPLAVRRMIVVAWNVHVGRGDVARLVEALQQYGLSGTKPDAIVLLLQEARRAGDAVPRRPPAGTRRAARIASPIGAPPPSDIGALATQLEWSLVYVPSMRNGDPAHGPAEDRGSAILSSLPLEAPHAIELPVERQRRVVVAGRVRGRTPTGRDWSLDVASVHLENRPGPGRGWIRAAAARTRQVEALLLSLAGTGNVGPDTAGGALVIGGDFNTWRGGREGALRLLRRAFPGSGGDDVRPTFGRLRLDYLFDRLPVGTTVARRRLDESYGSDHLPVVAEIDFGSQ